MNTYSPPVESNLEFAQHDSSSSSAAVLLNNKVLTTNQYTIRTGLLNQISNSRRLAINKLDGQASQSTPTRIDRNAVLNQRKGGRASHE